MRNRIKPLLLAAAGMIAPLGLLSVGSVQPALAASPASLPIASYYQMAVDAAHGHIFISQGSSGQNGILVTDLTGQVVTTITGQPRRCRHNSLPRRLHPLCGPQHRRRRHRH